MIKIGTEKLYTQTEILENAREYDRSTMPDRTEIVPLLAEILDEHPDFIRGALGI